MTSGVNDKPSLSGPLSKVQRAQFHLLSFEAAWQKVIDSDAFTFIHEVNADGLSHRYRAVDVPGSWWNIWPGGKAGPGARTRSIPPRVRRSRPQSRHAAPQGRPRQSR